MMMMMILVLMHLVILTSTMQKPLFLHLHNATNMKQNMLPFSVITLETI